MTISKAWFIMSRYVIAVLVNNDSFSPPSFVEVCLWDLSQDTTSMMSRVHLTMGPHTNTIKHMLEDSMRMHLLKEDSTSIILSCDAVTSEGEKPVMLYWVLNWVESACGMTLEVALVSYEWLRFNGCQVTFLGGFRRIAENGCHEKHSSVSNVDMKTHVAHDITLHFNINGVNWQYEPSDDRWKPLGGIHAPH
eukprot:13799886-Ditylum_brightwellii.AAC.1